MAREVGASAHAGEPGERTVGPLQIVQRVQHAHAIIQLRHIIKQGCKPLATSIFLVGLHHPWSLLQKHVGQLLILDERTLQSSCILMGPLFDGFSHLWVFLSYAVGKCA